MPQQPNKVLLTLDAAIGELDLTQQTTNITSARAAFDPASVLLIMIKVGFRRAHEDRFPANTHRTPEVILSSWG